MSKTFGTPTLKESSKSSAYLVEVNFLQMGECWQFLEGVQLDVEVLKRWRVCFR